MRISVDDLINYLRLKGPHNLEHIPTASEENAPLPGDEFTYEEGDSKEEGGDPAKARPMEEANLEGGPSEREPMEEHDPMEDPDEDPREDHSERETMEEADPKEDPEEEPSEREPIEEEDPEEDPGEDSEVSKGQLLGSEDQGEERREFIMQGDQTR